MNPKIKKEKTPEGELKPLTLKDYQDYLKDYQDCCGAVWPTDNCCPTFNDKFYPKRCPHPHCPENDRPEFPWEKCTLHEPIWISIPAGEHIHISCPVHPEGHILRGSPISYKQPRVPWGPDDFYKLHERYERPNLPEPDNNLPDYSKIGKVWM